MFFRQILSYTDSLSISISDLISTVVSYFDMSIAMDEREAEAAAIYILASIFCVDNVTKIIFLDLTGKFVTINNLDNRLRDVSYLLFACLCIYLTIPPLLSLIFRCRSLLLFLVNHQGLHSMQPSVVYRILC